MNETTALPAMPALPGQHTLLACWQALAQLSPGSRLTTVPGAAAAVFPASAYLNNAILVDGSDSATAAATASRLRTIYAEAGVTSWAMWVPSTTSRFDAPDLVSE